MFAGGRAFRVQCPADAGIILIKTVRAPFPPVGGDFVQAVAVWRKRSYRRAPNEPICAKIASRENSLPPVGHELPIWNQVVAPGVSLAAQTASRRVLELRFCWQSLVRPSRVNARVVPGHVRDRFVRVSG